MFACVAPTVCYDKEKRECTMDPQDFFKLMNRARQEAKKAVPFKDKMRQKFPVKFIAAVAAAETIAITQSMLADILPHNTLLPSLQQAGKRASRLLTQYHNSFVTDVPYAQRQKFAEVDKMVVGQMKTDGFVPTQMQIRVNEASDDLIGVGPHIAFRPIETHYDIKMVSGENGITPNRRHHDSKAKIQAISRWMTLLHETAHAVYEETLERFTPSIAVSKDVTDHINHFVVHQFFGDRNHRKTESERANTPNRMLSEGFADCYGAMMLIALTGDTKDTNSVITQFCNERKKTRKDLESGKYGPIEIEAHYTDFAFEEMLANKSQWITASPNEQKKLALTYASNGLLKMAEPSRVNTNGQNVGGDFNKFLGDFCQEIPSVDLNYMRICAVEGLIEGDKLFHQRMEGHPMAAQMKGLTKILKGEMETFLTHSSMEQLQTSNLFWRVVLSNPTWQNAVKDFSKQWDTHRTAWQENGRKELHSLSVTEKQPSNVPAMFLSAASVLQKRTRQIAATLPVVRNLNI